MIRLHGPRGPIDPAAGADAPLPAGIVWVDLLDPTEAECRRVEAATGIRVPSRAALSEVESSSRLHRVKGGLSLSTPMISFDRSDPALTPLGFVLTRDHLVTVRFRAIRAYDTVYARSGEGGDAPLADEGADGATGLNVFLLLLEELVDNLADVLEEMSGDLGNLSTRIFDFDARARPAPARGGRAQDAPAQDGARDEARAPKRRDLALRRLLRSVGWHGKALSRIRASLLGLERIVPFVNESCPKTLGVGEDPRFDTLARDIASLDEFETRQSETVQFLLDATLGLINIEQNSTFRILTVVSVVGVPPTLIASMYGMNFKNMPELGWTYGYPYALALIGLSALVPAVIFRARGWW